MPKKSQSKTIAKVSKTQAVSLNNQKILLVIVLVAIFGGFAYVLQGFNQKSVDLDNAPVTPPVQQVAAPQASAVPQGQDNAPILEDKNLSCRILKQNLCKPGSPSYLCQHVQVVCKTALP